MNKQPSDLVSAFLAEGMRSGASSDEIAELTADACRGIDAALTPIVGRLGAAALINRSLGLTARTYHWIAAVAEGSNPMAVDVAALESALARQTSAEAAASSVLFLKTFNGMLINLIGASLTERLLRSVWATLLSGPSAQDTTR
jgi:hypothetical protein